MIKDLCEWDSGVERYVLKPNVDMEKKREVQLVSFNWN